MAVTSAPAAPLLAACARRPLARPPVWFMRQAGRALPEYRAIRERYTLLDICAHAELAAEVTMQPVQRLGVDAAIVFADILLPLVPLGFSVRFAAGEGPVIEPRIAAAADVKRLRPIEVEAALAPTLETIRLVRSALPPEIAVIGFAGAPFTLASYLIEGGATRSFARTKQFMYAEPAAFHTLMAALARLSATVLRAQAAAGAQVLQLFDSWAGALSLHDYRSHVQPHSAAVFDALRETGVPTIHFGVNTTALLEAMRDAGGDVIGVDWRLPLDVAWRRIGEDRGIQGNLDPCALSGPPDALAHAVQRVLDEADGRAGHIFNLGHGVLPDTPVQALQAVVDVVRGIGPTR